LRLPTKVTTSVRSRAIDDAGRYVNESVPGVISAPVADGIVAADGTRITIRVKGEVNTGRADAVQTALREKIIDKFEREGIRIA
jgi:small-conductance mechanosensitive channel